jgi:hypothetical protein
MMNKLLAETVSILNGFLALLTIVSGGVIGRYLGPPAIQLFAQLNGLVYNQSQDHAKAVGIICGLVIGFFVAVLVYGLLALLIQMHRELKVIRQELIDARPLQGPKFQVRVEPRVPTLGS